MLNQDVSNDLFARNVRSTENGIELPMEMSDHHAVWAQLGR